MLTVNQEINICPAPPKLNLPTFAFVFYGNGKRVNAITRHPIVNEGLGPATIVSGTEFLHVVESALFDHKGNTSISLMPSNLLVDDTKHLIWHVPAKQRKMWFIRDSERITLTPIWPAILFVVDKLAKQLKIYALATNSRPGENTRLYRPPFMNIYSDNTLCQGGATLPDELNQRTLIEIEDTLFNSNFTHVNNQQTMVGVSNNKQHIDKWTTFQTENRKPRANEMTYVHRFHHALEL